MHSIEVPAFVVGENGQLMIYTISFPSTLVKTECIR